MSRHALEGEPSMGFIKKAAGFVLVVVGLIEQNKVALAGLGTAAAAVVHGLANGADATTLTFAVIALGSAATHLSVTPLSNPKTYGGLPLVPGLPDSTGAVLAPDPTP